MTDPLKSLFMVLGFLVHSSNILFLRILLLSFPFGVMTFELLTTQNVLCVSCIRHYFPLQGQLGIRHSLFLPDFVAYFVHLLFFLAENKCVLVESDGSHGVLKSLLCFLSCFLTCCTMSHESHAVTRCTYRTIPTAATSPSAPASTRRNGWFHVSSAKHQRCTSWLTVILISLLTFTDAICYKWISVALTVISISYPKITHQNMLRSSLWLLTSAERFLKSLQLL